MLRITLQYYGLLSGFKRLSRPEARNMLSSVSRETYGLVAVKSHSFAIFQYKTEKKRGLIQPQYQFRPRVL